MSSVYYYPLPTGSQHLISPKTGRVIEKNGPTYNKLVKEGSIRDDRGNTVEYIVPEAKTNKHSKEKGPFCGGVAGLNPTSYPVDTQGRAHSAEARSENAVLHGADPDDIKECACAQAEHEGWFKCKKHYKDNSTGKYNPRYADGKRAF